MLIEPDVFIFLRPLFRHNDTALKETVCETS